MGWQDDPVIGGGWQNDPIIDDEKKRRTLGESAARAGGLGVRDVVSGLSSLPNIVGDATNTAINYGIRGINKMGGNVPELGLPSQATQSLMTRAGLPVPESGAEQFTSAINRAVTGFAPMVKGAQMAGAGVQQLPFVKSMLTRPVAETAAVATGSAASEGAKQSGAPEWAQMAAGMAAPMAMSGAIGVTQRAASGINELRRPFTAGGAKQIAADVIGRTAQDKKTAIANLKKYNDLVESGVGVSTPGYKPTAAAVAGDYGIVGGEQLAKRGDAAPLFNQQAARNNEAFAADIGKLNATEAYVAKMIEKRDTITKPLRDAAFSNAVSNVDYFPVANRLGALAATPAGGRVESQKALSFIAKRLEKYQAEGRIDPENAYGLYKDVAKLIAGKLKDDSGADLKLAAGLAIELKKTLGAQITEAAPGFSKYMEHYARLSKPINRLERLTDKLGGEELKKITNSAISVTDTGASNVLSQDKMRNMLFDLKNDKGAVPLAGPQSDILGRVMGGLNSERFASTGGKQPGSDTYQNMASANFMSRIFGDTLAGAGAARLARSPLNLAFKPLEARIQDIVIEAYQNPKLMEELLRKARTSRGSPSLTGIANTGGAGLLGALFNN